MREVKNNKREVGGKGREGGETVMGEVEFFEGGEGEEEELGEGGEEVMGEGELLETKETGD